MIMHGHPYYSDYTIIINLGKRSLYNKDEGSLGEPDTVSYTLIRVPNILPVKC